MSKYALGHRYAEDDRDLPLTSALPVEAGASKRQHRYHTGGWMGDQNHVYSVRDRKWAPRPWCVSFGTLRLLEILGRPLGTIDPWTTEAFMRECEDHDEWQGNIDEGSSGRASMKVLHRRGVIKAYRAPRTMDELVTWVLEETPVGVGTPWYSSMFDPDEDGFVDVSGRVEGGHWWVVSGVNLRRGFARGDNSWNITWGDGGRFRIDLDGLERLVFGGRGEAWAPILR